MRITPVLVLVATLSLAACGGTDTGTDAGTGSAAAQATSAAAAGAGPAAATPADPSAGAVTAMPAGAYLTQADYERDPAARAGTRVVYFFHATWCPDCKATDASLTADGVPAGLTVVKVDYDTATELRKTYGITQQHTFVQVGADGAQLAKWTGTKSGESIKAKTL